MHKLYELKEKLMEELNEYADKDEMSAGDLEVVDKLTHTIKNLCKIIEDAEEYSEAGGSYEGGSYEGGGSYRNQYSNRGSYAQGGGGGRGGRGGSRGGQRARRGGYSSYGSMVERLEELMEEAPDMRTRQEIERLINKM